LLQYGDEQGAVTDLEYVGLYLPRPVLTSCTSVCLAPAVLTV